jgi:hypothetical protein
MTVFNKVLLSGASALAALALSGTAQAGQYKITLIPPAESVCKDCAKPNGVPNASPPANFNAFAASDKELQHYGFPPRPDRAKDPNAFAFWSKLVTLPVKRVIPKQQATTISNGPAIITSVSQNHPHNFTGPLGATSNNWSGYADVAASGKYPFHANNTYVYGVFVVPVAEQAFGACTGSYDYSSFWVGIDGWGSPDVMQAGIEADAYCSGSTTAAFYSAWYEWYPYNETRISSPAVAPGDEIYVYVWNSSPTVGNYYMANLTQNVASSLQFSAPSGTQLQGNSVEWIAERPGISGGLATLTNYVANPWWYALATTASGYQFSPSKPTGTTSYSITMLDNSSNYISYCTTTPDSKQTYIQPNGSGLYWYGTNLWCHDEGSAF